MFADMIKVVVLFITIFLPTVIGGIPKLPEQEKLLEHQNNFTLVTTLHGDRNNEIQSISTIDTKIIDIPENEFDDNSTTHRPLLDHQSHEANLNRDNAHDLVLDSPNSHISSRFSEVAHMPSPSPIIKTIRVPVEVPKPYAVHIPQPVPVLVHIRVPVTIEKPYAVPITRTIPVLVEKPVYIRVPQTIRVPVAQPYPVAVLQPVEVKVPYPVYIKNVENGQHEVGVPYPVDIKNVDNGQQTLQTEAPKIDLRGSFNKSESSASSHVNRVVALEGNLFDSYRPSHLGGLYGNSFNQYQ